jgi:outer membrane protein TolC
VLPASDEKGAGRPGIPTTLQADTLDLETVLRLTEQRNSQITICREQLKESLIASRVAAQSCVPDFLRQEPSRRISAEAKVWEQQVALSQTTHDVKKQAGDIYLSWLKVREDEAVMQKFGSYLSELLVRTKKLQQTEPATRGLVESIEAAIKAHQRNYIALHEEENEALDKLAYLLGVSHIDSSETNAFPEDSKVPLATLNLVDMTRPVQELIAQAANDGPTVRDLECLGGVLEKGIDQAWLLRRCANWRGCDSQAAGLLQVALSRRDQTRLKLADTRQRLALEVQEAYAASQTALAQISLARQEVHHAQEAYRLSRLRLSELGSDRAGPLTAEVLQSIQTIGTAHLHLTSSINAYNGAQLRAVLVLPVSK